MARVVPLSFKENDIEVSLYDFIKLKSSPSAYVKELIKIAKEIEEKGGSIYSLKLNKEEEKREQNGKDKADQFKPTNTISLSSVSIGR